MTDPEILEALYLSIGGLIMTDIAGRIAKLPLKDRASLRSDLQRNRPTVPNVPGTASHPFRPAQCQNRSRQSANLDDLGFEEIPLPPPGPGQIQGCARRHQHQLPGSNRSPWHSIHPRQEYLQ
jgi:hypothetical protein